MWFLLATSPRPVLPAPAGLVLLLATCCLAFYDGVLARLRSPPWLHWASSPVTPAPGGTPRLGPGPGAAAGRRRGGPVPAPATRLRQPQGPGQGGGRPAEPAVHHVLQLRQLVPFLPLARLPSLFRDEARAPGRPWHWLLLVAAVPALLLLAVGVGLLQAGTPRAGLALAVRPGQPVLVSLAEEALFRGYLQQRLGQWLGPARPGAGLGAVRPGALRRRPAADAVRRPRRADLRVGLAAERPPVGGDAVPLRAEPDASAAVHLPVSTDPPDARDLRRRRHPPLPSG